MKIYIYGTGSGAVKFYNSLKKDYVEVLGFLDSDKSKEGSIFLNKEVFYPETIKTSKYDYIMIASQYIEIYDFLLSLGFNYLKIIQVYCSQEVIDTQVRKFNIVSDISNIPLEKYVLTKKIEYQKSADLDNEMDDKYDFLRNKTLQLVADEIYANNVQGAVAEVGVYRGSFAKMINLCFKDRKLYLFDTFEGFNKAENEYDIKNKLADKRTLEEDWFKDTDIDIVLSKMKYRNNCIIKKGYFPDTASDVNEKFAFVSMDVDLFMPMYSALEFFYPKLSDNGYIFVHDYNNDTFLGPKKAVEKFESKYGKLKKVPIGDHGGTLIITK